MRGFLFWVAVAMAVLNMGAAGYLAHEEIWSPAALLMSGYWVLLVFLHARRQEP